MPSLKPLLPQVPAPTYIPYHVPSIGEEEIAEVVDTLRSGWLTTGPKTARFEKEMAAFVGAPYTVAVNSCTAGLHLALAAADLRPGDEVLTTPYTFAATAEVIIACGARPVFIDVEANGFNLDPAQIERAVTPRSRAIIPVHFAGEPCRMDEIQERAQRHSLRIIEDAAHALGAAYRGNKVGALSETTVFSFYATKNLTTGEGGMVCTLDAELAAKIKRLSLHGLSRNAWNRYARGGHWYYEIMEAGFKYNFTDLQASLGLHQLIKFPAMQQRRRRLAVLYRSLLEEVDELQMPPDPADVEHAWHLFVIRLRPGLLKIDRDQFIEALHDHGIGTSVHFIPLHLHPYYRNAYGFRRGDFPHAEAAYDGAISLPLYPQLEEEKVETIARVVKKLIRQNKKRVHSFIKEEL
ncbi:MAG: UDP-4-amino-4-deoxy-L-arabinose--oxoglutarate aminotransferase [bacterium ADurb.Bin478]|nr:MAG: UDP-4-amino-4-deoxy-L-arabinose--oxoglutarate aminotransferase [bacterium ADurb.Bin478]